MRAGADIAAYPFGLMPAVAISQGSGHSLSCPNCRKGSSWCQCRADLASPYEYSLLDNAISFRIIYRNVLYDSHKFSVK